MTREEDHDPVVRVASLADDLKNKEKMLNDSDSLEAKIAMNRDEIVVKKAIVAQLQQANRDLEGHPRYQHVMRTCRQM